MFLETELNLAALGTSRQPAATWILWITNLGESNWSLQVESSECENQVNHYHPKGKGRCLIRSEKMSRIGCKGLIFKHLSRTACHIKGRQTDMTLNHTQYGKSQMVLCTLGSPVDRCLNEQSCPVSQPGFSKQQCGQEDYLEKIICFLPTISSELEYSARCWTAHKGEMSQ